MIGCHAGSPAAEREREREAIRASSAALVREASSLFARVTSANSNGSEHLVQSLTGTRTRMAQLVEAVAALPRALRFSGGRAAHPMSLGEALRHSPTPGRFCRELVDWRQGLVGRGCEAIPRPFRKQIFDLFFDEDLYGCLRDDRTIMLSRGVHDPRFVTPPAAVPISLACAARNGWYGYSDPLGHDETRQALADLERCRRGCPLLSKGEVAVLPGATLGLNTLLAHLRESASRATVLTLAPAYPPVVASISQHWRVAPVSLDPSYRIRTEVLIDALSQPDVEGIVLSLPHNPAGGIDDREGLLTVLRAATSAGQFVVIDECLWVDGISDALAPAAWPGLRLFVVSSFSKTYAIPGLKLAHLLGPATELTRFYERASSTYGSPPSFLYLATTTLARLELSGREQETFVPPAALAAFGCDLHAVHADFHLWKRADRLTRSFGIHSLYALLERRNSPAIDHVVVGSGPSQNVLLTTRLRECSYRTFLRVLTEKNVSGMPIDCFVPQEPRQNSLRLSMSVAPDEWVAALTACFESLDNGLALETAREWAHPVDIEWLNRAAGYTDSGPLALWGHVLRVWLRCRELFEICELEQPSLIGRAATLHDLGKARWLSHRLSVPLSSSAIRLIDTVAISDERSIGRRLLAELDQLPGLPSLPAELTRALTHLWDENWAVSTARVLDLADKTSDFRIDRARIHESLMTALREKYAQTSERYDHSKTHSFDVAAETVADLRRWVTESAVSACSNV